MIADPLAILEEGEIHLGFSTAFTDERSGFNNTLLHDIDILVARLPAHLPSDIQKVCGDFDFTNLRFDLSMIIDTS